MKTSRRILMVMTGIIIALSVTLCGGSFTAAASTLASGDYVQTVNAARKASYEQLSQGASSGTVAVMVDNKIIYSEGFGLRDRAKSLPVGSETQYNTGSVSKIFSAAAILILVQEGKVNLDNPVTTYLPEFTMMDERYRQITVRMLLNHTSGFPGTNYKDLFTSEKNRNYVQETLETLGESYLKHNPGEISVYCNDGFTVAEAIVERVSGQSYAEFLEDNIFTKLGMKNTSAYFMNNDNWARSYISDSTTAVSQEYANALATGGLSTTAEDLCRYSAILNEGTVLNKKMIAEYIKPQYGPRTVPVGEPQITYGLGWDQVAVREYANQGITVLSKNGGTSQYFSQLYVLPKERIAIASIFTGNGGAAYAVSSAILQTLLEEKGLITKPEPVQKQPDIVPNDYKRFAGIYTSEGAIYKFELDPDQKGMMASTLTDKGFEPQGLFMYKDDGLFHLPSGGTYSFAEDSYGKYMMVHLSDPRYGHVQFEMLKPVKGIDSRAFANKVWVPQNLKASDIAEGSNNLVATGLIEGLEGNIYVRMGIYSGAALKDTVSTGNNIRYIRDMSSYSLKTVKDKTYLLFGGFRYTDAAAIPVLGLDETITIGANGDNEARFIKSAVRLEFIVPQGGRILVFSPDLKKIYDSILPGNKEVCAEAGSYLIAIGKTGNELHIINLDPLAAIVGHWSEPAVRELVKAGLFKETTVGNFKPDQAMSREQFLSLLARFTGIQTDQDAASEINEKNPPNPDQTLTRREAMSITAGTMIKLGLATALPDQEVLSQLERFTDIGTMDNTAEKDAALCVKMGIIKGTGNKLLAPDRIATWAEGAVILQNLFHLL